MKILIGVVLLCISSIRGREPLQLIEKLTVKKNRIEVTINEQFKKSYLKSDFFVEYDEDIDLSEFPYSIVSLPFITNVLSLIWISGKDYTVDEMDKEVYESFERLHKVFKIMYPKTPWTGRLIPKKLTSHAHLKERHPGKIALLFSGGVDSTASSFYHRSTPQLLITAWGQSELPLNDLKLWEEKKKRMIDFAHLYGHENGFIKSNYYYFLDFSKLKHLSPEILTWRINTIEDIGWSGLIAPLLLSRNIKTLMIASSDHWALQNPSALNPYIDGNIRFAGLVFQHDLFSMTRFQKISYIVNLCAKGVVQKPQFIICQKPGNLFTCGRCEKCCLTLALLLGAKAKPQEYGFSVDSEQSTHLIQKHLEQNRPLQLATIWDYKDLQKRVQDNPLSALSWLRDIDFSKRKTTEKENGLKSLDWAELEAMFPEIRSEKSIENLQTLV